MLDRYCWLIITPPSYPGVPLLALQENSKANEKQKQHWRNNQVLIDPILLCFPFFCIYQRTLIYICQRDDVPCVEHTRAGGDGIKYTQHLFTTRSQPPGPLGKTSFLHPQSVRWYLKSHWGHATVGLVPPSDPNWTWLDVRRFKMQHSP